MSLNATSGFVTQQPEDGYLYIDMSIGTGFDDQGTDIDPKTENCSQICAEREQQDESTETTTSCQGRSNSCAPPS